MGTNLKDNCDFFSHKSEYTSRNSDFFLEIAFISSFLRIINLQFSYKVQFCGFKSHNFDFITCDFNKSELGKISQNCEIKCRKFPFFLFGGGDKLS